MNAEHVLFLEGPEGVVGLPGSALLVAIDETGDEALKDPNHPIFGLGGCAVMVRDYERRVRAPWSYMKSRWFSDVPVLHAVDLRPDAEQIGALNHFFAKFEFFRLYSALSDKTQLEAGLDPLSVVGPSLIKRIESLLPFCAGVTEVAMVFEDSRRVGRFIRSTQGYSFDVLEAGMRRTVPIRHFAMPKAAAEPALEVADFLIHTAGAQVRKRLERPQDPVVRQDFRVLFRCVDRRLTHGLEITRAGPTDSER